MKLAVDVAPGGSGVLALNALSKGDYAEASLEVFFLIPWLRFAGGRLNHITIVARNGDEVIVSRRAVEAWQQGVYNATRPGESLTSLEKLGQALKAGGRNADEVVETLRRFQLDGSPLRVIRAKNDVIDSLLRAGGRQGGLILEPSDIVAIRQQLLEHEIYLTAGGDRFLDQMSTRTGTQIRAMHRYRNGRNIIYIRRGAELNDFVHEYMHALDAAQYQRRFTRMPEIWREYANFCRLRGSQYWDVLSSAEQGAALENVRNLGPWRTLPKWIASPDLTTHLDP